ncbi:MAG: hypothetical protein QOF35_2310 [Actinomycetota bacterium]|jgi:hypothetical protein|nr:hypothetical protein [Actinomycetota bacterium]
MSSAFQSLLGEKIMQKRILGQGLEVSAIGVDTTAAEDPSGVVPSMCLVEAVIAVRAR